MSYLGQQLGQGQAERFVFTASGGETSVTTSDDGRAIAYTVGQVDVYLNGAKLINGSDFTATTGTSITGLAALTASDVVEVFALSIFQASDTVSAASGGTFNGNVTVDANLSVTGTADIDTSLNVDGTVTADGLTVSAPSGDTPASIVTTTAGAFLSISDANTTAGRSPLVGVLTDDVVFYTSTGSYSEKVRIKADGNVGIGVSSPTAKLHILADTPVLMNNAAGTSEGKFDFVDSGATLRMHNFFGTGSNITFLTNPNGGAVSERMRIDSSGLLTNQVGAVFNESGADSDFRVESDTNTHMLHVDAGNNSVGIGRAGTSGDTLTVLGSIRAEGSGSNIKVDAGSGGYFTRVSQAYNFPYSDGFIEGVAAASYHSRLLFTNNTNSGSQVENLRMSQIEGAVFNEGGVDLDFRVESDNSTHALFVDAGNDRVGINVSTPANTLDVGGNTLIKGGFLGNAYSSTANYAEWSVSTFSDNDFATSGTVDIVTTNSEWQPNLLKITVASVDPDLTDYGSGVFYVRINTFNGTSGSVTTVDSWTVGGTVSISVSSSAVSSTLCRVSIAVAGSGTRTVASVEALSYAGVSDTERTG